MTTINPTCTRKWAMPNKWTFSIAPIKEMIKTILDDSGPIWVDPFCGQSPFKDRMTYHNDLVATGVEALDFLRTIPDDSVDGVLFDPPYSPRQISECYKGVGRKVHMQDTQSSFYGDRKKEVARIVKPNGFVLCFGWNSGGIGKTNGFTLLKVMNVAHGGAHNDTICTLELKQPTSPIPKGEEINSTESS